MRTQYTLKFNTLNTLWCNNTIKTMVILQGTTLLLVGYSFRGASRKVVSYYYYYY